MDNNRYSEFGRGTAGEAVEWLLLVVVVPLLTMLVLSWVTDGLAQAAQDTGKTIGESRPADL